MRVGDMAQMQVVTTFRDESLADAAQRMREYGIGSLVVMDVDVMTGVITERDLIHATADAAWPEVTKVSQYMTADPIMVTPLTDVSEAERLMVEHGIRHLPVVRDGRPVGMVSARDLLALRKEDAGR